MKLPKKLTYQRSLSPSHAIFYAQIGNEQTPLQLSESMKIIGQKSSSTDGFDGSMKIKKTATSRKLAEANIQTVDYCHVPPNASEVSCKFSLRVDSNALCPLTCDDTIVMNLLQQFSHEFTILKGWNELASRYLKNIFSGSWLWRNQNTIQTNISINTSNGNFYQVENINRKRFDEHWETSIQGWELLIDEFSEALTLPRSYLLMEVCAQMKCSFAQEIHPSQSFIEKGENQSSRIYQHIKCENQKIPIIGTYKVGAAIACIDDWVTECSEPIRVGAYGVNKDQKIAYRTPIKNNDLFSSLMQIEKLTQDMSNNQYISNDCYFVAANLIKGGVFNRGKL